MSIERKWRKPLPWPELAVNREIIRLPYHVVLSYKPKEYYVGIPLPKYPILVTTFVAKEEVEVPRKPKPGEIVDGHLKTYLYGRRGTNYFLDVPGETVFTGSRIEVSEEYIQKIKE